MFGKRKCMYRKEVSTLVVEWIEIFVFNIYDLVFGSPPSWWSGLKFWYSSNISCAYMVSTLVVEWIEICRLVILDNSAVVSTLVVEWIEIKALIPASSIAAVSTLVVEWIEITCVAVTMPVFSSSPPSWWSGLKSSSTKYPLEYPRLHPRGGVD